MSLFIMLALARIGLLCYNRRLFFENLVRAQK